MTPNPPPRIDAFVEGATEVAVIRTLADRELLTRPTFRTGDKGQAVGKEAVLNELKLRIAEWAKLPAAARSPLRIVVVLDQDDATLSSISDSLRGALRAAGLGSAELEPLPGHERALVLQPSLAPLSLSLHIAGSPAVCDFFPALSRRSIDDDVLRLAMDPATAEAMLAERHESRRVLGTERLLAKVKTELPALLAQNGLAPFVFAKDHIRFYAAVLGISTSPAAFAQTVVKHARQEALASTCAPLLAAFAAV